MSSVEYTARLSGLPRMGNGLTEARWCFSHSSSLPSLPSSLCAGGARGKGEA